MSTTAPRAASTARLFQKLAEGKWIDEHANLLICGPTGVGKSWLASALGHKACRDNRSVLYQRVPRLFAELALARGDGRHRPPAARARPRRSAHPRRLGPRPARCRCASRSPGNPRRALRPPLHHRHQPNPGRPLACSSSATRPMPTPSSIASSTMPTASISQARACAGPTNARQEA